MVDEIEDEWDLSYEDLSAAGLGEREILENFKALAKFRAQKLVMAQTGLDSTQFRRRPLSTNGYQHNHNQHNSVTKSAMELYLRDARDPSKYFLQARKKKKSPRAYPLPALPKPRLNGDFLIPTVKYTVESAGRPHDANHNHDNTHNNNDDNSDNNNDTNNNGSSCTATRILYRSKPYGELQMAATYGVQEPTIEAAAGAAAAAVSPSVEEIRKPSPAAAAAAMPIDHDDDDNNSNHNNHENEARRKNDNDDKDHRHHETGFMNEATSGGEAANNNNNDDATDDDSDRKMGAVDDSNSNSNNNGKVFLG